MVLELFVVAPQVAVVGLPLKMVLLPLGMVVLPLDMVVLPLEMGVLPLAPLLAVLPLGAPSQRPPWWQAPRNIYPIRIIIWLWLGYQWDRTRLGIA